eukprot:3257586-Pyramimonas_sp.AAC.1
MLSTFVNVEHFRSRWAAQVQCRPVMQMKGERTLRFNSFSAELDRRIAAATIHELQHNAAQVRGPVDVRGYAVDNKGYIRHHPRAPAQRRRGEIAWPPISKAKVDVRGYVADVRGYVADTKGCVSDVRGSVAWRILERMLRKHQGRACCGWRRLCAI